MALAWRSGARPWLGGALSVTVFLLTTRSLAAPSDAAERERARVQYAEGQRLHKKGDYRGAAEAFARADDLSPSAVALGAALDAAQAADDAPLAMSLVERAGRAPDDAGLRSRVTTARGRFAEQAGRAVLHCADCSLSIDGAPVSSGKATWLRVGRHAFAARFGELAAEERTVDVTPSGMEITFQRKEAPRPAAPPTSTRTWSPAVFYGGAIVTGLLAIGTTASALGAQSTRDDFTGRSCAVRGSVACDSLASDGRSAQLRTNLLGAATVLAAGATAAIALIFVRWPGDGPKTAARSSLSGQVSPSGFSLVGTFE